MLAIVAAFKEEIKDYLKVGQFKITDRNEYLRAYLSKSLPDVVVIVGGFGKDRSQEAVEFAIERYRANAIISPGFAGGARAGLTSGDLFVCELCNVIRMRKSESEADAAFDWVAR